MKTNLFGKSLFVAIVCITYLLCQTMQAQTTTNDRFGRPIGNGSQNTNTGTNTGSPKPSSSNKKGVTPKPTSGGTTVKPKNGGTNTTNSTPQKGTSTKQNKAQNIPTPRGNGKNGIFFGGGINSTTDTKNFMIDVQPFIGYRANQLLLTAGPVYQYQSGASTRHIFGARTSARYDIVQGLYGVAQFEALRYQQGDVSYNTMRLPIGAGYSQSFFGIGANLSVMYDVLYSKNNNSPYATPFVISGGINLGGGNGFNFGKSGFDLDKVFKQKN